MLLLCTTSYMDTGSKRTEVGTFQSWGERVICWIFNNRFKTSNSSDSSQDLQFNWIQWALIWYFSRLGKFFVFYGLTKICEQNTADVKWFYLSHKYLIQVDITSTLRKKYLSIASLISKFTAYFFGLPEVHS